MVCKSKRTQRRKSRRSNKPQPNVWVTNDETNPSPTVAKEIEPDTDPRQFATDVLRSGVEHFGATLWINSLQKLREGRTDSEVEELVSELLTTELAKSLKKIVASDTPVGANWARREDHDHELPQAYVQANYTLMPTLLYELLCKALGVEIEPVFVELDEEVTPRLDH